MLKSQELYTNNLFEKKQKLQIQLDNHFKTYCNYKTQTEVNMNSKVSNYVTKLSRKQTELESRYKLIFLFKYMF